MGDSTSRSRRWAWGVLGGAAAVAGGLALWRWHVWRRERLETQEMFDDAACAKAAQAHKRLEQQPVAVIHQSELQQGGADQDDGWETESEHREIDYDEGSELERLEEEAAVIYERDLRVEWKKLIERRAKLMDEGKPVPPALNSKLEEVSRELDEIRDWRAQRSATNANPFEHPKHGRVNAKPAAQQRRPFGQEAVDGEGAERNYYYGEDEDEFWDDDENGGGYPMWGDEEEEAWHDDDGYGDEMSPEEAQAMINQMLFGVPGQNYAAQSRQAGTKPKGGVSTVEEIDEDEVVDARPRGRTKVSGRPGGRAIESAGDPVEDPTGEIMAAYEFAYREKLRQQQGGAPSNRSSEIQGTEVADAGQEGEDEGFATTSEEDTAANAPNRGKKVNSKKALKTKTTNKGGRKGSGLVGSANPPVVYL